MPTRRTSRARQTESAPTPAPSTPARKSRQVAGQGDEVGAAALGHRVATSLRELRKERRLSLDQLAASSGVSRAALSQIEGSRTNPTLSLLWKVATGLGVPFQVLLGGDQTGKSQVLRAGDSPPLRSADGRMESRLLSPAGANQNLDIYELRLLPNASTGARPMALELPKRSSCSPARFGSRRAMSRTISRRVIRCSSEPTCPTLTRAAVRTRPAVSTSSRYAR